VFCFQLGVDLKEIEIPGTNNVKPPVRCLWCPYWFCLNRKIGFVTSSLLTIYNLMFLWLNDGLFTLYNGENYYKIKNRYNNDFQPCENHMMTFQTKGPSIHSVEPIYYRLNKSGCLVVEQPMKSLKSKSKWNPYYINGTIMKIAFNCFYCVVRVPRSMQKTGISKILTIFNNPVCFF